MKLLSHVRLSATPWTVAYQAPPSMGFSRQEYWSGFPFPSPGDLPDPGIEPRSPAFQADALTSDLVAKSCPTLATHGLIACQASLSVGFSGQEYWSVLSFLSPGDLPDPGIETASPALGGRFFTTSTTTWEAQ